MLIAERNGLLVADGWKNPYVTDGLVAMWDGEWNVGGGKHDANAASWVDLSGNGHDIALSGDFGWSSDACEARTNAVGTTILPITLSNDGSGFTMEFVNQIDEYDRYSPLWQVSPIDAGYEGWYQNGDTVVPGRWGGQGTNRDIRLDYRLKHYVAFVVDGYQYPRNYVNNNLYYSSEATHSIVTQTSNYTFFYVDSIRYWKKGRRFAMRFYNRPLSNDEIAANYAIDKIRFNLP